MPGWWKRVCATIVPSPEIAVNADLVIGKIRPLVDSVFAFEDTLKAYERLMSKRATGKVVVKVDPAVE